MTSPQQVAQSLIELYRDLGQEPYGEHITQEEHAIQCAALAEREGAPEALVLAALLHDVGHLVEQADDAYGHHRHDRSGADYLGRFFGSEVTEPVRLHVAAKRYLCAVEPGYQEKLSPASAYTLSKQGGPMSAEEAAAFEANERFAEAVRLRRWDEGGKVEDLEMKPFKAYRPLMEKLAR
jgi:gamma-butyrobetaine dioxygenase